MKILRLLSVLCALCASAVLLNAQDDPSPEPPAWTPRTLTLPETAPHPQARVDQCDITTGAILYTWLDADGQPVDSGNSIAHLTPTDPPSEPTDEQLAAAILASTE